MKKKFKAFSKKKKKKKKKSLLISLSSIKTKLAINFPKKNFCNWPKKGLELKGLNVGIGKSLAIFWVMNDPLGLQGLRMQFTHMVVNVSERYSRAQPPATRMQFSLVASSDSGNSAKWQIGNSPSLAMKRPPSKSFHIFHV